MGMSGIEQMSREQMKEYAASTEKIAAAIEALVKTDGWQIFLALFEKEKEDIRSKDYDTLEAFKADRQAILIVEGILEQFRGYIEDADTIATLLKGMSTDNPQPRGVMLIEHQEKSGTIEG